METFWFFWAYDSAYSSDFWFPLGCKLSYNSDYYSGSSEFNQPLGIWQQHTIVFLLAN